MPKKIKKQRANIVKAIVLSEIALAPRQMEIVSMKTPPEFIKYRVARGKSKVPYIEGGYVVNQLNRAFSPLGWQFEILEQNVVGEKQVWVRGRLTIIDHKKGWKVSKEQYGQHDIHTNIPVGDSLKSAGTDCLKKCASMLGIGLDVYWRQLDLDSKEQVEPAKVIKEEKRANLVEDAIKMIRACKDNVLLQEWKDKIADSKLYNKIQKDLLSRNIDEKIAENNKTQ